MLPQLWRHPQREPNFLNITNVSLRHGAAMQYDMLNRDARQGVALFLQGAAS